jgi:RNA ligase
VIDPTRIAPLLESGTVKAQRHPARPLTIYNYTPLCQYEQRWCPVSRACRGLILADDGAIVARPFPKFHNADEHSRSEVAFSKPFSVTEKLDGSLGILYEADDGLAIATRGSFTSEQARRATTILRREYSAFRPAPGLTYLFEIIYPENRVVVDYGRREELILLTVIDNATGRDVAPPAWPGPRAREFQVDCHPREVMDALGLADDGNTEGVVLRFDWPKTGPQFRVKVKLEEYKRLHRILCQCSTKTVWEALAEGRSLDEITERVPDEFNEWLRTTVADFRARFAAKSREADAEFRRVAAAAGTADRKAFAALAVESPVRAMLFKLLDGRPIDEMIWRELRPEFARPFRGQSEDVA